MGQNQVAGRGVIGRFCHQCLDVPLVLQNPLVGGNERGGLEGGGGCPKRRQGDGGLVGRKLPIIHLVVEPCVEHERGRFAISIKADPHLLHTFARCERQGKFGRFPLRLAHKKAVIAQDAVQARQRIVVHRTPQLGLLAVCRANHFFGQFAILHLAAQNVAAGNAVEVAGGGGKHGRALKSGRFDYPRHVRLLPAHIQNEQVRPPRRVDDEVMPKQAKAVAGFTRKQRHLVYHPIHACVDEAVQIVVLNKGMEAIVASIIVLGLEPNLDDVPRRFQQQAEFERACPLAGLGHKGLLAAGGAIRSLGGVVQAALGAFGQALRVVREEAGGEGRPFPAPKYALEMGQQLVGEDFRRPCLLGVDHRPMQQRNFVFRPRRERFMAVVGSAIGVGEQKRLHQQHKKGVPIAPLAKHGLLPKIGDGV